MKHARPSRATQTEAIVASWRAQPISIRVLRAFLGLTFVFAGLQKMADPNFLHPGSIDFIGRQLHDFAHGSPIGPVLLFLARAPVLTGIGIALLELAIGLAILLGIAQKTAAVAGFLVNVALFLSATWHIHPYFLGSDSIYAVAWAAYGLWLWERERAGGRSGAHRSRRTSDLTRRDFIRGGVVVAGALFIATAARAFSATRHTLAATSALPQSSTPSTPVTPSRSPITSPTPNGKPVMPLSQVPVGGAAPFTAPSGQPAVVVRLSQNDVVAYSRVCTHAGCLVGYDPGARILVCPCHGAEFDPSRNATPVAGPTFTPLPRIDVAIDQASGEITIPT